VKELTVIIIEKHLQAIWLQMAPKWRWWRELDQHDGKTSTLNTNTGHDPVLIER
jgi:hypothetical protein